MSSVSFVGIALEVESVTQIALATVRVEFTQDPLAVSSSGTHDALNAANYAITGPGSVVIKSCGVVYGNTQAIDIFTTGPIPAGNWLLTVSNVQTASGASLQAPTQMAFTVTIVGGLQDVNGGAVNDSDEDLIHKHLNPYLKGKGWDALVAALATGEKTNRENNQLAFDQLFTSTASGLYLERRAADSGIQRPDSMGLSDALFRDYVIRVTNNKLTEESFLEVLETFYGDASVRASNTTAQSEPYALHDGDDLTIVVDEETTIPVVFATSDFAIVGAAKAVEVAAAITRAARNVGSTAWAAPSTDPVTGISTVVIYSGSLGLSSAVRVAGGRAQNVLQFADVLPVYGAFSSFSWTITFTAATNTVRFTTTSSVVDLTQLRAGDYVNIYGTEFATNNQGSFTVTNVGVTYPLSQYFEIVNTKGFAQTVTQTAQADLLFFRPTRETIHAASDRAVIVSVPGEDADVIMPATSQAVIRQELSGAYGIVNSPVTVSSMLRQNGVVTATATSHGFSTGDWVYIDGAVASSTLPTVVAGNGQNTTAYAATTTTSLVFSVGVASQGPWCSVVALSDGRVLSFGGMDSNLGTGNNATQLYTVTGSTSHAPNGTQYTVSGVADANYPQSWGMIGAVRLTNPAAGNKALACGGTGQFRAGVATGSALSYLYTPVAGTTGSWTATGSMNDFRAGHALVQRSDYLVMAIGGVGGTGTAVATTETYNSITGTWTLHASLNVARVQPEALQLNTTDVLVVGGRTTGWGNRIDFTTPASCGTLTNVCELYNISGNTWTNVGPTAYARVGHRMFLLDDGRVICIGGIGYDPTQGTSANSTALATTEIYDPNLKHWYPGPTMGVGRAFFAAARSGNKIYIVGGAGSATGFYNPFMVEYLDLTTMKFKVSANRCGVSPCKTSATMIADGLMFTGTGMSGFNSTNNTENIVLTPAYDTFMAGGQVDGLHSVTRVDANTFTFTTDTQDYTSFGACTATPVKANSSTIPGPFVYDPQSGVAVTGSTSTLSTQLSAGLQYASITVADATQFPDEPGWLVFDFGYAQQFQPVRYLGRLSSTQLALDYTYKFPQTIPVGASVTLLQQKGPWVPSAPQSVGSFYLTDSSSGRIAAASTISSIAAAGVTVNLTVAYPGDYGLGNWGYPSHGNYKISDEVLVWGSNDPDTDLATARET